MTTIQYPNKRIQNPDLSISDPIFITDIVNANSLVLNTLTTLLGGADQPYFAVLSGMNYNTNTQLYTAGYVLINGQIYYVPAGFAYGKYTNPVITPSYPVVASDGNSYNSYNLYTCTQSDTQPNPNIPVLAGDLVSYRLNLKYLKDKVATDYIALHNMIVDLDTIVDNNYTALDSLIDYNYATLNGLITTEAASRIAQDTILTNQINANKTNIEGKALIATSTDPMAGTTQVVQGDVSVNCSFSLYKRTIYALSGGNLYIYFPQTMNIASIFLAKM